MTGLMKGSTKVTTVIKAKKGKKTKSFKVVSNVKVNESPFFQQCTGDLNVTVIDPLTLKISFPEVVSYLNQTQFRIFNPDGTQLIIAENGVVSEDGGKTHTITLMKPGVTAGLTYSTEYMGRDERGSFSYMKKPTYIFFKDGTNKAFKKIQFEEGAKIGELPLAANPYNQTVKYRISGGKDRICFDVDENGNLIWHKTNGITPGLKKFEVEVTAETEQTEILEGATATIMCTVTLK